MKKTGFIFSIHNHQPFGNFDDVIESCFRRSYRPLIDTLSETPFVKTVLHISGPLLIWLKKNHTEHIEKITLLIKKGQLELLGGTFSEAVISTLPEEDRILQIEMYKNLISDIFSKDINLKGFWLTERVFTPDVIKTLCSAGYKYTFLDDTHIKKSGSSLDQPVYLSRYLNHELLILPINRFLRYEFPFKDSDEIIKKIKKHKTVIHADDGEKLGDWPGMYDYLYKEKRLSKLFCDLRDEDIDFIFPDTLIKENPDPKEIFIPYSSYDSMNKWSMNTGSLIKIHREYDRDRIKNDDSTFYTGNYFNFFIKYSESGTIYKKNLFFSSLFHHDEKIKEELLRSQCCCGYWHGVFGGIYLPHMRDAINLGNIYAENSLPEGITKIDKEMIVLKKGGLSATIKRKGACLSSINSFKKRLNILNTITRRPEFYHSDIREPIYYDLDDRISISEYVVSQRVTKQNYLKNNFGIQGNFKNCLFEISNIEEQQITFYAKQKCLICDELVDIKLTKTFFFEKDTFCINFKIEKSKPVEDENTYLMTELNFHNVYEKSSGMETETTDRIIMNSKEHGEVILDLSDELYTLNSQIKTDSIYHQKNEKILQSNTIVLFIPINKEGMTLRLAQK